jgi:hypothetical protein
MTKEMYDYLDDHWQELKDITYDYHDIEDNLPSNPSELIRLALQDLKICVSEGMGVDMGNWCINYGGFCTVCLAGAVIRQSLHIDEVGVYGPTKLQLPTTLNNKLHALNVFKNGNITRALNALGYPFDGHSMEVTQYKIDPDQFFRDLESIANYLESIDV